MKRLISILLIFTMLLPLVDRVEVIESQSREGGQYVVEDGNDDALLASIPTIHTPILLKATTLRRFSVVRVKCLRLLRQKPIIHSESARHSELRSGDVSTMRI